MANFESYSRTPISQAESGASTLVFPTIPYLPSIQTSTTVPVTSPETGNTNSGQAAKSVTLISDKPKEPTHGFIDTIKKKTGHSKENPKRSKSDDPK